MSEQITASGVDSFALSDIAHVEMGQSPDSRFVVEDPFQGLAFLQGNAEFGAVYPEPKFGCLRPAKKCKANDVLISVRAPVGAINLADRDYCIGRGLAAIRGEGIKPSLLGEVVARQLTALRRVAQGTTFEAINKKDLLTLKLSLPPKTDWPQIAEILDTLDTAIHETEAIIAKLKAVKQGLLHDLLTRGIDANGELRPPQAEAPHLYKQSPLGWIPKEWDAQPLGCIAEVSRGKFTHRPRNDSRFYGGMYPFIQTGDVAAVEGEFVSTYSQTLSDRGISVSQEFPAGTIAITIAANIADTAILAIPMYFPDSVVGAIVDKAHNGRFVELSIRKAKRILDARAPQSAQKNINLQDLRPLLLAVPEKPEQDAIAIRYETLQNQLQSEQDALAKYRFKKSGLMDDLLTGRVRVTPLLAEAAQQQGSA